MSKSAGGGEIPDRITTQQMREFSDLIRNRRKELGLSQMQLGDLAGVSQTLISALERGPHVGMRVYDLFKVLRAIHVEPNEAAQILGFGPFRKAPSGRAGGKLGRLIRDLEHMDAEQQERAADILEVVTRGLRSYEPSNMGRPSKAKEDIPSPWAQE